MDQTLFEDLVQSLKEAKAISRGEMPAARRTRIDAPDVKAVREQIGLSQSEFARLIHVSVKTRWQPPRSSRWAQLSAIRDYFTLWGGQHSIRFRKTNAKNFRRRLSSP